jgi:hypothetical protein
VKPTNILVIGPTLISALFIAVAVSLQLPVSPLMLTVGLVVIAVLQALIMKRAGISFTGLLMAVVAYDPCNEELPTYSRPGDCIDEGTGIIGFLLIKRGFNISTTITDAITYAAAKTAEDIIVINEIEAFWPQATQVTIPGLAGRIERHSYFNYDLPFKHEGVDDNLAFWNNIKEKKNYGIAFITEEYKAFAPLDRDLEPILCSLFAVPSGEQEFGKIRFMQGNVKWKHKDLVYYLDNLTKVILKPDFQV